MQDRRSSRKRAGSRSSACPSSTGRTPSPTPKYRKKDTTMAPLVLEGETLGQRHRHYNGLVKAAVAEDAALPPLNYEDPDADNLLRIDVACSRRDVDYVLKVLESDDMLYVSRVIKQSTWLITDDQYAHIINPEHLHNELFPKITSKAKNKLLLAIRLNLKNESRVEEFFKYYSDDLKVAQKWLPRCSPATIEQFLTGRIHEINTDTFKRLCENSIIPLKLLLKDSKWYYLGDKMTASKALIDKHAEEYINTLIEGLEHRREMPTFGINATRHIMQRCGDKVLEKFKRFANHLHLPTFAKCLKKEDIPDFLIKQATNKEMKYWIKYDNIKHFVKYLPVANRFEFVKKLFIDKEISTEKKPMAAPGMEMAEMKCRVGFAACSFQRSAAPSTNAGIYRWYRFAPFDTAFVDLKKLIRVESSPGERNAILTVLINCARHNPAHVKTLLQFYREKHMNEPFKFKIQFVNTLISLVETHKFDTDTWGILNDIFSSMEVYIESDNSVPYCVRAIIVYKLLHNEDIPEIIEKKFTTATDTFKEHRKKLGENEREKLFAYLYKIQLNKLNKQTTNNEVELTMATDQLSNLLNLLKDWKKKISDYPEILEKIRSFIKTKKELSLTHNLSHIYDTEKKWKRDMFEESLLLDAGDEVCVNALKHDPGLLLRYSSDVEAMCSDDSMSLKNTLRKLRIYWSQSLAQKWGEMYLKALQKPTGHKATVEGICILLTRKQFMSILEKYTPVETKIDWSDTDTATLSLRKNIAKRMQLVRPPVPLDAALTYAKNDYLQFALPSLNALLYNMSATQVSKQIPLLFDAPVSLKKHGLRLAYTKLKFSEIKDIVEDMWKNTKNSSIKTVLFKETFQLLKKAKKETVIKELWQLLSMFIDNLTPDENRVIYDTLGKANDVPLIVRPQFYVKSYTYLISLPAKANCESIVNQLEYDAAEIIDVLEPSFVENVLLKPVSELINLMTGNSDDYRSNLQANKQILAAYLVTSENEETQLARYEKYLAPILDSCFKSWKINKDRVFLVRDNCTTLLNDLFDRSKSRALKNLQIHIKLFKNIEMKLRTLPLEENYSIITFWAIGTRFIESYNNSMKELSSIDVTTETDVEQQAAKLMVCPPENKKSEEDNKRWEKICNIVAPQFGQTCLKYLKEDLALKMPTLEKYFNRKLMEVFNQIQFNNMARLLTLKEMLDSEIPVTYLIVLEAVHSTYYSNEEDTKEVKRQLYEVIGSHPSPDVKIHFNETLYSDPPEFVGAVPYLR